MNPDITGIIGLKSSAKEVQAIRLYLIIALHPVTKQRFNSRTMDFKSIILGIYNLVSLI